MVQYSRALVSLLIGQSWKVIRFHWTANVHNTDSYMFSIGWPSLCACQLLEASTCVTLTRAAQLWRHQAPAWPRYLHHCEISSWYGLDTIFWPWNIATLCNIDIWSMSHLIRLLTWFGFRACDVIGVWVTARFLKHESYFQVIDLVRVWHYYRHESYFGALKSLIHIDKGKVNNFKLQRELKIKLYVLTIKAKSGILFMVVIP